MIINFSVKNFASFNSLQSISFEATNSQHLESYYVIEPVPGIRLLKLGLIYGANASGKSNLLKAMDFLKKIMTDPLMKKNETIHFYPFLFNDITPIEPSFMAVEFISNGIKYLYEVSFTRQAVLSENLFTYQPKKAVVYNRTTKLNSQLTQISFGSKIKIQKFHKNSLETNTLWNNTVIGGYAKTNFEQKDLENVTEWFNHFLITSTELDDNLKNLIIYGIDNNHINKNLLIQLLQSADFDISNLNIKTTTNENKNNNNLKNEEDAVKNYPHWNEENESKSIELEHQINHQRYVLPFELESSGTRKYLNLSGLIIRLIRGKGTLLFDELESSLHPDLFTHFILLFLANAKNSQLIATTHNREILNDGDLFRDDAIWITHKNELSETQLYSLADFDSSILRDTSNRLNAYKSGKLGGIPNLGDFYINLSDNAQ